MLSPSRSRGSTTILGWALAAVVLAAPGAVGATTFVYDWSTASASAGGVVLDAQFVTGDNNDNWVNIAGTGTGIDDGVLAARRRRR